MGFLLDKHPLVVRAEKPTAGLEDKRRQPIFEPAAVAAHQGDAVLIDAAVVVPVARQFFRRLPELGPGARRFDPHLIKKLCIAHQNKGDGVDGKAVIMIAETGGLDQARQIPLFDAVEIGKPVDGVEIAVVAELGGIARMHQNNIRSGAGAEIGMDQFALLLPALLTEFDGDAGVVLLKKVYALALIQKQTGHSTEGPEADRNPLVRFFSRTSQYQAKTEQKQSRSHAFLPVSKAATLTASLNVCAARRRT
ncbi:MAG: hypothetical protein BWY83_03016 [bacterium ADurb.Bin478]|nr:MAG: hypothetical protein BWY83_03016 [bacterium ADurb.Bin478]